MKTVNYGKVRVQKKVVGFSSASLPITHKEMGGSHPGWNHRTKGIDHLIWRRTEGPGIVKGWEDK